MIAELKNPIKKVEINKQKEIIQNIIREKQFESVMHGAMHVAWGVNRQHVFKS